MAQKLGKKLRAVLLALSLMAIGNRMAPDCAVSTVMASETGDADLVIEDLQTEGDGELPEESSDEEAGESMAEQTVEAGNEEDSRSDTGSNKETEEREAIRENKTEQAEYITDRQPQGQSIVSGNDVGTVSGETGEAIHRPQILLRSCNLSGAELGTGSKSWLESTFKNMSESETIYNLKVTVGADSSFIQFSPGSFYFSTVNPGEEIRLKGELKIDFNAESGVIPLIFDFNYEDREGVGETGQERANLSVVHPTKMELDVADIPSYVYASETRELSLKAFNLSRAGVYNVRISLSGTGLFPMEDVFIGNMEAGTEETGTMRIYIGTRTMTEIGTDTGKSDEEKYGGVNGIITLKYEDAKGKTYEIEQDFHTEIKKAQILSLNVNEEVETNSWQTSVFVIIIIGLAILAISLWLRLRKKNVLLEEARQIKNES